MTVVITQRFQCFSVSFLFVTCGSRRSDPDTSVLTQTWPCVVLSYPFSFPARPIAMRWYNQESNL